MRMELEMRKRMQKERGRESERGREEANGKQGRRKRTRDQNKAEQGMARHQFNLATQPTRPFPFRTVWRAQNSGAFGQLGS